MTRLVVEGGQAVWRYPDGLCLPAIAGGEDDPWDPGGLDPFASEAPGAMASLSQEIADWEGQLAAAQAGDGSPGERITLDEFGNIVRTTDVPGAQEVTDLRDAPTRIANDPVLRDLAVDENGDIVYSDGRPVEPGVLESVRKALGAAGEFLSDGNIGRALATLLGGAAALGAGRLAAGGGRDFRLPPLESGQNPIIQAGQQVTAEALANPAVRQSLREALESGFGGWAQQGHLLRGELRRQAEEDAAAADVTGEIRSRGRDLVGAYAPTLAEGEQLSTRLRRLAPLADANLGATPESLDPLLAPTRARAEQLLAQGAEAFRRPDSIESALHEDIEQTLREGPARFAVQDPVLGDVRKRLRGTLAGGPEALAVADEVEGAMR